MGVTHLNTVGGHDGHLEVAISIGSEDQFVVGRNSPGEELVGNTCGRQGVTHSEPPVLSVDGHSPVLEPSFADTSSLGANLSFRKRQPEHLAKIRQKSCPLGLYLLRQIDRATDADVVEMRIEEAVGFAATAIT
jgi:hypothetical protein